MAAPTGEVPRLPGAVCIETDNPDAFFSTEEWQLELARNMCRRCPEIRACLAWALTHKELGLWAGTTEPQRAQLLDRHSRNAS